MNICLVNEHKKGALALMIRYLSPVKMPAVQLMHGFSMACGLNIAFEICWIQICNKTINKNVRP